MPQVAMLIWTMPLCSFYDLRRQVWKKINRKKLSKIPFKKTKKYVWFKTDYIRCWEIKWYTVSDKVYTCLLYAVYFFPTFHFEEDLKILSG